MELKGLWVRIHSYAKTVLTHNICSFHSSVADDSSLVGFDRLFFDEVSKECSASIIRVSQSNKNSCWTD